MNNSGYLEHHGILGMHWGIRRFQNKDGTLTEEGKRRYNTDAKFKDKYDRQQAWNTAKKQIKFNRKLQSELDNSKSKNYNFEDAKYNRYFMKEMRKASEQGKFTDEQVSKIINKSIDTKANNAVKYIDKEFGDEGKELYGEEVWNKALEEVRDDYRAYFEKESKTPGLNPTFVYNRLLDVYMKDPEYYESRMR